RPERGGNMSRDSPSRRGITGQHTTRRGGSTSPTMPRRRDKAMTSPRPDVPRRLDFTDHIGAAGSDEIEAAIPANPSHNMAANRVRPRCDTAAKQLLIARDLAAGQGRLTTSRGGYTRRVTL